MFVMVYLTFFFTAAQRVAQSNATCIINIFTVY